MSFLWFALIGIAAGYIAGRIMKGRGFGLIGNLIVGIVGAMVGGWALGALGFYAKAGLMPSLITAVLGAVILLYIVGLIRRL
ncbi:MAG: GlsB/YeaQ/YmgE family stress response membrane protein [Bacteroidia bacterium]